MAIVLGLSIIDSWVRSPGGPNQKLLKICYFPIKHATLCMKNKDWLSWNQDMSDLIDMSTWWLLHQWVGTIQIKLNALTISQWLAAGRWFFPGTPVSSTNKTDHHNIAEIWLNNIIWRNVTECVGLVHTDRIIISSKGSTFSPWYTSIRCSVNSKQQSLTHRYRHIKHLV